jgi:pyruvate dehydrogenase E1 component beta subunit/2-oxoisovalerate dehydrogenase E1 component beta subunit
MRDKRIQYIEAIRAAQHKLLADDPRVFIYGQDVSGFGGAFKATRGLAEEFPGRVLDSPISEDAQVGLAIGAALEGMRPIVEMQFADFSTCGYTQIVQHAATMFWRTNVPCPIVIRLPCGGTPGTGPFHSQSMEAIYAHYPGLVVMTPATVEDAYSMLIEAVAIDDPVIFCEHKFLYNRVKSGTLPAEDLPDEEGDSQETDAGQPRDKAREKERKEAKDKARDEAIRELMAGQLGRAQPTGKARVARPGRDATVVTYSAMVHEALECAEKLATEGWEIEVIDLRSVKPLDTDTVLASVSRTGRLLTVGEAFPWGGVTAEVIARVATEGFGLLDAPPMRLNAKDTPVPYHPNLWGTHRPTAEAIAVSLRELLRA